MKIEVEKNEYDELVRKSAKADSLQADLEKSQEESKNKGIALDKEREKSEKQKADADAKLEVEKERMKSFTEKLGVKEGEDILKKIDTLNDSDKKYSEILKQEAKERTDRIASYKERLGEEFVKEKESLLEGLDEGKQETILKEFIDAKGLGTDDDEKTPKVGVHKDGKDPSDGKKSDFEKLEEQGAGSDSLIGEMANNI